MWNDVATLLRLSWLFRRVLYLFTFPTSKINKINRINKQTNKQKNKQKKKWKRESWRGVFLGKNLPKIISYSSNSISMKQLPLPWLRNCDHWSAGKILSPLRNTKTKKSNLKLLKYAHWYHLDIKRWRPWHN